VPRGLERIKSDIELPHTRSVSDALALAGQRDQQELTRFYLDRGRRLFAQESDREALAELNRALFLSPYESEAHLLVARIHLRAGRVPEAIDALKISIWSAETAVAHVALAEAYLEAKDLDAARAEAQRALVLDPTSADARRLVEQLTP
jgi:Tfp pilus assembly protein PilF